MVMDQGGAACGSVAAGPAVRVSVETVLLTSRAGRLYFRIRAGALGDRPARSGPAARLLHSTSWRFTAEGLVLTYAAVPDPRPDLPAAPVPTRPLPRSDDSLAPSPTGIGPAEAAAHACRHLAYLRHTDPVVAGCAASAPALWRLIDAFTPTVAGLLPGP